MPEPDMRRECNSLLDRATASNREDIGCPDDSTRGHLSTMLTAIDPLACPAPPTVRAPLRRIGFVCLDRAALAAGPATWVLITANGLLILAANGEGGREITLMRAAPVRDDH